MVHEGKSGIVYAAGEWEQGQLGLPWSRTFMVEGRPVSRSTAVPSTGTRIVGRKEIPAEPAAGEDGLVTNFCLVPLLRPQKVTFIAAGGDHSFAVAASGRVFAFGKNDAYQLGVTTGGHVYTATSARVGVEISHEGVDDRSVGPEPLQVVALRWKSVVEIACGDAHSLARCENGTLYSWGMGAGGRLGHGHFRTVQHPTKVKVAFRCVKVAAGYYHSLALTDQGLLYAWGSGDGGQLGTGRAESSHTPQAVSMPADGRKWISMSAGEYHSAALTDIG